MEFDEEVKNPVAPAGKTRLVFMKLIAKKVQEDVFLSDEVKLSLHLGVDGTKRHLREDGVKPGTTIVLKTIEPVNLDPGRDGEVWFWGDELGLGATAPAE